MKNHLAKIQEKQGGRTRAGGIHLPPLCVRGLPPFSLLRDFSFQNTSEHFAIRFRQSYLIWKVSDVTAIELSSKE